MPIDCGFTKEDKWFRYKACAIIIENSCVLFAGNSTADYFYPVGGAVHAGETAENAVIREVYEETGIKYEIDRLAVIHENFFKGDTPPLKDLDCHEISFYFLMKPRGTQELHSDSYTYGGVKENMHWIPIEELERYMAYPSFLNDYLSHGHSGIKHIVTDERNG
ncbi:MAG: NUDIX domain-containing protein [Oscillospiraceae bacterium]|nr:NUDIX domain-containing protein [Oscillospiraceae bacterium]